MAPVQRASLVDPAKQQGQSISAGRSRDVTPSAARFDVLAERFGEEAGVRLRSWSALVASLQGRPERERVEAVHSFFAKQVAFRVDQAAWGKDDYWATPAEFVAKGQGDCEDFAIARYFSLRQLGVPADRLAVAYAKRQGQAHMALVYRDPAGLVWVLDNLETDILRAEGRGDLTPGFAFNESYVWATATLGQAAAQKSDAVQLRKWKDLLERIDGETASAPR